MLVQPFSTLLFAHFLSGGAVSLDAYFSVRRLASACSLAAIFLLAARARAGSAGTAELLANCALLRMVTRASNVLAFLDGTSSRRCCCREQLRRPRRLAALEDLDRSKN